MKRRLMFNWKLTLYMSLILALMLPSLASASQNHYFSGGWSLYSMTFDSVDSDNGICYQGAKNWTTAAGTTMTQDSASRNKCYYRYFPETWYGLYTKYNTYFTIQLNKDLLEEDYAGSIWNASVSSATHEFGHAQYLGDHDTDGEGEYATTSIMSYSRNRATMTTPQSHDLADLNALRNPSFAAPESKQEAVSVADFPLYNIDQLLRGKTDLVIVAHVESVTEIKENNDPNAPNPLASHQEAVLRIDDTIYGQAKTHTIKLYQSVDKVIPGQQYLLFLSYRPALDQYVVSDGASQSRVDNTNSLAEAANKVLTVKIKEIQGLYSNEELKQLLNEKSSKL